jgi:hypothetical protein
VPWLEEIDHGVMVDLYPINIGIRREVSALWSIFFDSYRFLLGVQKQAAAWAGSSGKASGQASGVVRFGRAAGR